MVFLQIQWNKIDVAQLKRNNFHRNTDGWFDKSDPFLRLSKIRTDNTLQKIFETEVIKDNLNPHWNSFEINLGRLC